MLVTLIPLFDENMAIKAYSLFTQRKNFLLNPNYLGTAMYDGAARIEGLEVIENMGIDTLSLDKEVFVSVNNLSIFSDIEEQCSVLHNRIVLLVDTSVKPEEMYINRIKELKDKGFKIAMRKIQVQDFEKYRPILSNIDYILLNHKKIDIEKAKIYFSKIYPNIKLCAVNISDQESFEKLKGSGGYQLYEGEFYRVPVTKGEHEVSPLKINYIELMNVVNSNDFELTKAADIIGHDTALTISLLKIVNNMARNSEITSIRHAAAMLGQKELKKWITTAVVGELCLDRPNEITRLSMLRARFAENLAPLFGLSMQSSELFLMGLFSVIDAILDKPMEEALTIVNVSKEINEVLIHKTGIFAPLFEFMLNYENANWQEVSRILILQEVDVEQVYDAYIQSLIWYRKLTLGK